MFAVNCEGVSALHDSVQHNHLEISRYLIAKGGEKLVNMKTNNDLTPIDLATTLEMKKLLLNVNLTVTGESGNESENLGDESGSRVDVSEGEESLNVKAYENVEGVCCTDVNEYLFLLTTLIRSFTSSCKSAKKVGLAKRLVETQWKMFSQHLQLISSQRLSPTSLLLKAAIHNMLLHNQS